MACDHVILMYIKCLYYILILDIMYPNYYLGIWVQSMINVPKMHHAISCHLLLRYPNISTTQMEQLGIEVPLNQYDSIGAVYYTYI